MQLPSGVSRQQFERVTGYQIADAPASKDGARAEGDSVTVTTAGGKPIELPLAEVERLYRAYEALRGPDGPAATTPDGEKLTLTALRADLNRSLFDGSPLVVTEAEARHAHGTLMAASPALFSSSLGNLDDKMLNRYVAKMAKVEPFALDSSGPSAVGELVAKIALELDPEVGKSLVARLGEDQRQALTNGVMELGSGAMVEALRSRLGEDGFRTLVQGPHEDALVGRGLLAGKTWTDNGTETFKTRYADAVDGKLPIPPNAKDTVFLAGPGLFGDQLPGYLEPNRKALEAWGVPPENVSKLDFNTAAHPTVNADRIYEQVKAAHDQGKPVVVMGHSKFGRDMLEAFARHPDLKDMISGALLMQPALSAQIAKDLGRPEMAKILDPVLKIVGGDRGAFDGLAEPMEDLPPWPGDAVPTVVMASSSANSAALLNASVKPYYGCYYDAPSDGAVSFQNQASIDDATLVALPGLADHAQPGLTFSDLCEHFAEQMNAGAPDDVINGMMGRLESMCGDGALFKAAKWLFIKAHDTPEEREDCAKDLRKLGPMLDRIARVKTKHHGQPLVDNGAMTQALMSQLFDKMSSSTAAG